jgi:hypothetical protein
MEGPAKKRHGLALFGAWVVLALISGIAMSNIPWGKPEGIHGVGYPVAGVIWDKPAGKTVFVDYPNPLAYVINPLAVFVAGLMFYGEFRLARALLKRKSGQQSPA